MRRRIGLLVAAATSAVVLAFVVPLCVLTRTLAEDHAMDSADQEARNTAAVLSGVRLGEDVPALVDALDRRGRPRTTVLMSDGRVLGSAYPDEPAPEADPLVRRAARGIAFERRGADGGHVLVPVVTSRGTDVVRTTVSPADMHRGVMQAWVIVAGLGLLLLVLAVATADRVAARISTPVIRVARVADRLHAGDLAARADETGPPETMALAGALNRLAARIEELLVAERAAVGDLSHRMRTPITALRLEVDQLTDDRSSQVLREHVARLQRTVDAIVREARQPVRTDLGARCDAAQVLRDRVAYWSALAEDEGRAVGLQVEVDPAVVPLDERDLADLVDILVDNVFAHTPEGTGFAVALEAGEDDGFVITVADDGPGFPGRAAGSADRVGATGLGLDIVRRRAEAAGGRFLAPRVGSSRVGFRLPAAPV